MSANKIFITGGTGKIGRFLLDRLLLNRNEIILLCDKERGGSDTPRLRHINGDLLLPDTYSESLKGVDTVVHMAAITHTNDVHKYYEVNAKGTSRLINECKLRNVKKFIFVSTRAISEKGGDYSRSKLEAEGYVRTSGLDWIILRPAEVYGIGGEKGINVLLNNISKFLFIPIIGSGNYRVAPLHVNDLIHCIIKAIENDGISNKLYTIAGPEAFTYNEFIDKLLNHSGIRKVKIHIPLWLSYLLIRMAIIFKKDSFAIDQIPRLISEKYEDISLAVKDLDYRPRRIFT